VGLTVSDDPVSIMYSLLGAKETALISALCADSFLAALELSLRVSQLDCQLPS
jgi:hypothetical protein